MTAGFSILARAWALLVQASIKTHALVHWCILLFHCVYVLPRSKKRTIHKYRSLINDMHAHVLLSAT